MLKGMMVVIVVVVGGILLVHYALDSGSALKYMDEHQEEAWVPASAYYLGEGYYLFQNLQTSATYFLRVAQRYPKHPLADDAYFSYLQCLDDSVSVNKSELMEGYRAYLDKYPKGKHVEIAQNRYDNYRTSSH